MPILYLIGGIVCFVLFLNSIVSDAFPTAKTKTETKEAVVEKISPKSGDMRIVKNDKGYIIEYFMEYPHWFQISPNDPVYSSEEEAKRMAMAIKKPRWSKEPEEIEYFKH